MMYDTDSDLLNLEQKENKIQSLQLLFTDFLRTYKDSKGDFKYRNRIHEMLIKERKSLPVDYEDLINFDPYLIDVLEEDPEVALRAFSESIKELVSQVNPDYAQRVHRFYPRLSGWIRTTPIRGIRSDHINKLILIEGIIVRATPPREKLFKAVYLHTLPSGEQHEFEWPPGPGEELGDELEKPTYCPMCISSLEEEGAGRGRLVRGSFKLLIEKSKYRDWQLIVVQERPEEVPAGQIPRSVEVVLTDDIVDIARPGDRVSVVGIVRLSRGSRRSTKPVFSVFIEANNLIVAQRFLEELKLSPEDEEKIRELSRDPLIRRKIIASIAPTIYGMWDIKEAVALLLFGGVPKIAPDGTKIRGDIHVLLLGDPGTAKSLCYSEPILLFSKSGKIKFESIGKVIDEYMRKYSNHVKRSDDTEVLNLSKIGEEIYTVSISPLTLQPEVKRVRALIRHKAPSEVLVIKTKTGRTAVITKDHSLVAFDGVKLKPIKPSEAFKNKLLIPILKRVPLPANYLPEREVSVGKKRIHLDNEFGYLIGYFIGDGAIAKTSSEERIEIVTSDRNIARKLAKCIESKFSIRAKVYAKKSPRKLLWRVVADDREVIEWFKNNLYADIAHVGKKGYLTRNKIIPEFTYNAPADFIAGVLSGLIDSNGTVIPLKIKNGRKWRGEVSITITSNRLAQGISLLLSLLGITHTIRHKTATYNGRKLTYHTIFISDVRIKNVVKLENDRKASIVERYTEASIDAIDKVPVPTYVSSLTSMLGMNRRNHPLRNLAAEIRGKVCRGYAGRKYCKRIIGRLKPLVSKFSADTAQVLIDRFDSLAGNGYVFWDVIKSISKVKITDVEPKHSEYVYDISVEDNENFAGGLGLMLLHNSQILQYTARIAPRGIYTTGKGSSAAGLTATVIKDKQTGEYFLEAGAMVLADGGIVCIDEIDKMRDEDRVAIHEAMEQGTVSIAKAGIVARLNARASVLAAGNPKHGRYIPNLGLTGNINLPVTILSRFDLIFILKDIAQIERDRSLVRYVLETHETLADVEPEIPPELLRKYIAYARKYVKPRITKEAQRLIEEYYIELRKKSAENPEAPLAITTRQLEALIRLAEAHARMRLKNKVEAEDAAEAIRLMNSMLEMVGLDIETGDIDIDTIMTGKPKSMREKEITILNIIKEFAASDESGRACIKLSRLRSEAEKLGIDEHTLERIIRNLKRMGDIYERRPGCFAPVD
ncbi:MAG: hypothetical protein J7J20_01600 [Desulfurococcales archaeon]|nr:hypothetical protein [Desulfurococcales archaeon]